MRRIAIPLLLLCGCLMGCASLSSLTLSKKPFIHVEALGGEITIYGYEVTDKRTLGEDAEVG